MKINLFSKVRTNKEGRQFTNYIGRLKKKDGTEMTCNVKFKETAGHPDIKSLPAVVEVLKANANLAKREYLDERTGELKTAYTLWVNKWAIVGEYVDHSLDDFDD